MNDITLPVISAYSENHPEDFRKGKILVVLSNAKLTYRTSTPEGKQHSSIVEARECFLSRKAGTDQCDSNGVYLKFSSTTGKEVKSFLCQKYINK